MYRYWLKISITKSKVTFNNIISTDNEAESNYLHSV